MNMRSLLLAVALVSYPFSAMADEHLAGQWRADQGHGVLINMDVLADGHWLSQTIQDDKVVAEMAGTYEQTPKDNTTGRIVFTPLKSQVSKEHGAAKVEQDTYTLKDDGKVLVLSTGKEAMTFHNTTAQ
jgi:hypothetical protein